MTVNKYFQAGNFIGEQGEQRLLEDLITESIQIYGTEVWYIPRTSVKPDTIFGEDILSQFTGLFPIEAYLDNIQGWNGAKEVMSKFGIEVKDEATFVIARKRWYEAVVSNTDNVQLIARPAEGDLLYFPLTQAFFEINFVDHLTPFYQLGNFYVFVLKCGMFRYSSENIVTGTAEVDQHATNHSFDMLKYEITGQDGTPLLDQSGNPIIETDYDSRTLTEIEDSQELETESQNILSFDENNPFGEI